MFIAEAERRFQPCKVQRMLVSAAAQAVARVAHVGQGEGHQEERLNSPVQDCPWDRDMLLFSSSRFWDTN